MSLRRTLACAWLALWSAGCGDLLPDLDLERMIDQPRGKPFQASPYFPDGRLMRTPPDGTVPVRRVEEPDEAREGPISTSIPVPVDRALLLRGKNRFEIFCAACHGADGSGSSEVARNMTLRPPPALVSEPVRSYPVGRVYRAIAQGYGLMPGYPSDLDVHDRWAVVAYLRALQRSQSSALAALPENVRQKARQVLP